MREGTHILELALTDSLNDSALSCDSWPRPKTEDSLLLMTSPSHQAAVKVILFIVLNITLWVKIISTKSVKLCCVFSCSKRNRLGICGLLF